MECGVLLAGRSKRCGSAHLKLHLDTCRSHRQRPTQVVVNSDMRGAETICARSYGRGLRIFVDFVRRSHSLGLCAITIPR
jgi:hypothetical protein